MKVSTSPFQQDFDEIDFKVVKPNTTRLENIGPWVENNLNQTARKHRIIKNVTEIENQKSMDFLATVQKGNDQKRSYRRVLRKPDFIEKQVFKHENFEETLFDGNIQKQIKAKIKKYSLFQSEQNQSLEPKKVLSTTIYICESNYKLKYQKQIKSDKDVSLGYENCLQGEESSSRFKASHNFQKILKMKEKLRVKNNLTSKQVRQKYSFEGNEISNYSKNPIKMLTSISNEAKRQAKETLQSENNIDNDHFKFKKKMKTNAARSLSLKNAKPKSNLHTTIQGFECDRIKLSLFETAKTKLFRQI